MPAVTLPDPHWCREARPYVERLARHCGLSDSAHAEAIVAEAMQAAAESQWSREVLEAVRRLEDDGK